MKTNIRELSLLTQEAATLSNKNSLTKAEEKRFAFLTGTAIPAVKAGASLAEVDEIRANADFAARGLPPVRLRGGFLNEEKRAKAMFMLNIARAQVLGTEGDTAKFRSVTKGPEFRTETLGSMTSAIGSYSNLGSFVPTDFYAEVFAAMGEHDPLYDVDGPCTVLQSTNGHAVQIPVWDDIVNLGSQVGEGSDTTGDQINLGNPNAVTLGVHNFRSPVHTVSMEADQDIEAAYGAFSMFKQFMGDRLARTIGAKLISGNGSSTVLGLLAALAAANAPSVVAAGSSDNTGGTETCVNSIGTADLGDLYFKVNAAWRSRPSCGWLMNDNTLTYLTTVLNKMGNPIFHVENGVQYILNKPVYVSPSMASIGSSNVPVIFGDLSQWVTKIVSDDMTRIQRLDETYIEQGLVGFRMFVRAGGVLAYQGDGSGNSSPLAYLINHS
jgi:HK97 family phage major capsid protein